MVEAAKALATFIRDGGVYAGLALALIVIAWQHRRTQVLTDLVLATKEAWRLSIEAEKDKTLKHVMEIAPLAKEMVGITLDWREALGGAAGAEPRRRSRRPANRPEREDHQNRDEAAPARAPEAGGGPVGG